MPLVTQLLSYHAPTAAFPQVWDFLHDIYGGGPLLKRRSLDIYAEPADTA